MPHFGLINEKLSENEQYLMRARLHIRGGKIRLKLKQFSDGIQLYMMPLFFRYIGISYQINC